MAQTAPTTMVPDRGIACRWSVRTTDGPEDGPLLERVLAARRLSAAGSAFLNPKLVDLHDPALMPGLDKAARRILDAARSGEAIVIYGDYDADGVTASAILYRAIRGIEARADVRTYVPHRIDEGYGLNTEAIESLVRGGERGAPARLIVSVDCGITASGPAQRAKELGIDLIVTDHHTPATGVPLPETFATVHPGLAGGTYPFPHLCGAGVAYKLAWRMAMLASGAESAGGRVRPDLRALLLELLPLAAIGSVADVVPLIGENRVLAKFGLGHARSSRLVGLRALISASGLDDEHVRSMHAGFMLGPRLNAAGRMGHAREAVELLTTDDERRAREIAETLSERNDERRRVEDEIVSQACEAAEARGMLGADSRAIVLADERWHPGVIGIACSRLVERYHRPTILLHLDHERAHGSGRSIEGFNLHAAVELFTNHLEKFGGHDMAVGLSMKRGEVERFAAVFRELAANRLGAEEPLPTLVADCRTSTQELTPASVHPLSGMEPFGRANPPVSLVLSQVVVASGVRSVGEEGKHRTFSVRDHAGEDGRRGGLIRRHTRIMAWRWAERLPDLQVGQRISLIVEPAINTFNGLSAVEPSLKDIAVH